MWDTTVPKDVKRDDNPWHNTEQGVSRERPLESGPASTLVGSTPSAPDQDGTWGERDAGQTDQVMAMEDFENLRRELTGLSKQQSRPSLSATRTKSRKSVRRLDSRRSLGVSTRDDVESKAGDNDGDAPGEEEEEDFELSQFMEEGHFEKRKDGRSAKKVGVLFKNLTVKGIATSSSYVRTLPEAVLGTFGPDLYRIVTGFIPALNFRKPPTRDLIKDFTGVVRDGEMMLVLGRPGSGCSTFLKAIANNRDTFVKVDGEVSYGGISAEEQRKHFRGEVNYNPEDDRHMAKLNVIQTFTFALMNKTKRRAKAEIDIVATALMKMFGISHTKYTMVGDEYTRGISGGERKRVSIAETLATKSTVTCWDNSTRGLDASTALDYAKSLRIMTDISDRTTLVTLYQAGEGIYELMDKVLVIDDGRCVYQGLARDAKQYFIDLGFYCPERQTTADFLTAVTDPIERRFRDGYEARTPKTPEELEHAYLNSEAYQKVLRDVNNYEHYLKQTDYSDAKEFEETVREGKSKRVPNKSNYTVPFWKQVYSCFLREYWLLIGDTTTLYTKFFIIISNALIVGSLFYGEPLNTAGAFPRGGALFFSILFLGWLQLTELMKAVSGRAIMSRQKEYAFYTKSAVTMARVLLDFPFVLTMVIPFCIIMYFMTGLDVQAGKFFIYMLFVYTNTLVVTSLYRMFASLSPTIDDAVRFAGISLNLLILYTGYVIPKPQLLHQKIWFGWLYYINPISYSFEGVLTNEFSGRTMACDQSNLVPQGPGADPRYQGCSLPGSGINEVSVTGSGYIGTTYEYTRSHLWRNWGALIAWGVLYLVITVVATEIFSFAAAGGGALVFKKSRKSKQQVKAAPSPDEEKAHTHDNSDSSGTTATLDGDAEREAITQLSKSESIFTWEDVNYSVPYQGGQRQLLNSVNGYAKPGVMVALMGASGAGKTTLLNTLAQRQYMGVVSGDMLVDGKPLGRSFQRGTGFCEQMDLHDGTATIREALEFSALLRQDSSTPRSEKIAYVDNVIALLELEDIQDAIVSSLGVEQRKRLTIGVELAAKPSLLLFLDEPTSGLDSQSAANIIRFLKKLSASGQSIICTIHQPSSLLIQQFDMILALNPGGNTFYFGPVGENGSDVINYFAARGVNCPPEKNVAEFILETAAKPQKGPDGRRIKWNDEWKNSEENKKLLQEIQQIKEERSRSGKGEKQQEGSEFAAPIWTQTLELTKRTFIQYWRNPSYFYGKIFVATIVGIFNGFTFWMLGNTTQDMTNRMFTAFIILVIPPTVVNSVVPKFYGNMALWQAREYPSRIYGWFAFCTAQVVGEIPIAIITSVIYWLLWYFPTGLPTDSSTAGYVYLMTLLFFFFMNSWGQWICAFAPSFTVISNILPFFFVNFSLFNGVVRPYSQLPVFWKYWMYYVNPSTYWIGGVIAATLKDIPVECQVDETAQFNAPPGQTCQQYAGAFARSAGGYLLNPEATFDCQYCPYTNGTDYMSTLNIKPSDKWRYFGIFLAFVISNWMLVYFFIYTVRIKGWSFGFGYVFGVLGKVADLIKAPFKKLFGRKKD
ncbi:MAG: hypothetical protein M1822_009174 [Bathelium mastoideum]|nr:MAG: hypothetical protein M1822_009174 [Bathelium mastoideum]